MIVQQTARISTLFSDDATAVLDSNDTAFAHVPKSKWAIGGHSAGGYGASAFVRDNPNRVVALVMHAGGLAGNLSTWLPVLNIVGTIDRVAQIGSTDSSVPVPTMKIEGANHYQTGDYGYQSPDNVATISQDEQQTQFARATAEFLNGLSPRTRV